MSGFSSRLRLALVFFAWASLAAVGCSSTDDYAVVVSWAVNGFAPSADDCDFYGIQSVRLTVQDGARKRTIEGDCGRTLTLSDGYPYGGYVSTEWFVYGSVYSYQLDMIGTHGESLINAEGTFVADYGDVTPVELPTLDFFAPRAPGGEIATVTGSFSVGTGELAQDCAAAGINRVELWVYSVLDFDFEYPDRALFTTCDTGALDSGTPLLNAGDYQVTYVALNYTSETNYTVVQESDPIPVLVEQAGAVQLPAVSFTAP
ncbi:MAG: hypothetical protein QM778_36045 [Myxococcales bacterium]